jgi:hypothetical protein
MHVSSAQSSSDRCSLRWLAITSQEIGGKDTYPPARSILIAGPGLNK